MFTYNWNNESIDFIFSSPLPDETIAKNLGVTVDEIVTKRKEVLFNERGGRALKKVPFCDREVALIKENENYSALVDRLGRSKASLAAKRRQLGLVPVLEKAGENSFKSWDKEAIELIKSAASDEHIAKKIKRSPSAVRRMRTKKGIEIPKKNNLTWTEEEVEYLKKNMNRKTIDEISKKLGRTPSAVKLKISRSPFAPEWKPVKSSLWTDEEDAFLIEFYGTASSKEIAQAINRSVGAVTGRATKLRQNGLLKNMAIADAPVEKAEIVEKVETAPTEVETVSEVTTVAETASEPVAVEETAPVRRTRKVWTTKEEALLLSIRDEKTVEEIAEMTGRTVSSIKSRLYVLDKRAKKTETDEVAEAVETEETAETVEPVKTVEPVAPVLAPPVTEIDEPVEDNLFAEVGKKLTEIGNIFGKHLKKLRKTDRFYTCPNCRSSVNSKMLKDVCPVCGKKVR